MSYSNAQTVFILLHDPSVFCQPLFSEFIATTTYLSRSFALPALSRTEYIKQIVANVHRITLTFSNNLVWERKSYSVHIGYNLIICSILDKASKAKDLERYVVVAINSEK